VGARHIDANWSDVIIDQYQRFYRLAYAYVKNEHDAMDIVQEAFLRALRSAPNLHDSRYTVTWFYRVVINTALSYIKRHARSQPTEDSVLELYSGDGTSEIDDTERALCLRQAIDKLPPKYKNIVLLRYAGDLKTTDIAQVLRLNVNTVKTRLYKALKMLRVDLSGEMEERSAL
jgi:RNA polymerase sigma-70 factor (ECF subfamily)